MQGSIKALTIDLTGMAAIEGSLRSELLQIKGEVTIDVDLD
jgi:hypothetical protein